MLDYAARAAAGASNKDGCQGAIARLRARAIGGGRLASDCSRCGNMRSFSPVKLGGTMASMRCGPGVRSACSKAAKNSSVVVARLEATPIPSPKRTKSIGGVRRSSWARALSLAPTAPTRCNSTLRMA